MGDQLTVDVGNLRVSQDWDECSGVWKPRGKWLFLELIDEFEKQYWPLLVSIKQIWYDVRVKNVFNENVKEWTVCSCSDVWRELLLEVVVDNFKFTMKEFFQKLEFSGAKELEECYHFLELNGPDLYALLKSKPFDEISRDEGVSIEENDRLDALPLSSLVKPTLEDEAPCVSPPKMAIVASSTDKELPEDHSCANHEKSCNSSRKVSKKRNGRVWIPGDSVIVSEYCAGAIEEYLKEYCKLSKSKHLLAKLKLNLRRHLLFLGWKVGYFQDTNSQGRDIQRWRYTQPDGNEKCFLSLIKVCQHFRKSESAKVSSFPQDQHNRLYNAADPTILSPLTEQSQGCKNELIKDSPDEDDVMFEPEYCPQAVINYYSHEINEKVHNRDHDKLKDMQLKAKKHLSAVGWKLYYIYKNNAQSGKLRYSSPCGKLYCSLRLACKGYLEEKRDVGKLAEAQLTGKGRCYARPTKEVHGKHKLKRKSSALHLASCLRSSKSLRKVENSNEVLAMDNLNCAISDRVLGSRKRAREVVVPSSYHRNPRTILSWLIDKNVVLPRAKVQYRRRRDAKTMAEGRVTRDGIKCNCCQKIYTLSNFELHAKSTLRQPSANIFLEDGRSLQECQMQLRKRDINARGSTKVVKGKQHPKKNDNICSVCHIEGTLILCDRCPSSFHTSCLGMKEVPDGDWFCPSCCCKICGEGENNGDIEVFTDNSVINCDQCERRYHISCLKMKDHVLESYPKGYWFCNKNCQQISFALQKLLGKPVQVGIDNLTWTLLKYVKPDDCDNDPSNTADSTENYSKLNVALGVMHECFEPMKEPRTRRDIVEDVIFNRWSELKRLNFRGFYTVLLEKNDELVTAATVRIYGEKVAELPLVATRFLYRRRGMCRILMNELEKVLIEVGVQRLVLPAVSSVLNTWISSFGFSRMPQSEQLKLLDYTFLNFAGTTMCQKLLLRTACIESGPITLESNKQHCVVPNETVNMDLEGSSSVSESQRSMNLAGGSDSSTRGVDKVGSVRLVSQTTGFKFIPCQREIHLESSVEGTGCKDDANHGNGKIKVYKRRRISKPVGAQVSAC